MSDSIYAFSATTIDGNTFDLSNLHGKVVLIVNTASQCGFTKQYAELEELYAKYHEQGLEIIGFPCNQFGNQEPGSDAEIQQFCSLNYGITFPMMSKIKVNGNDCHPLYQYLKQAATGILGSTSIKWNFTKFLISRDGQQITRFAPQDKPLKLASRIEELLAN